MCVSPSRYFAYLAHHIFYPSPRVTLTKDLFVQLHRAAHRRASVPGQLCQIAISIGMALSNSGNA
jgi:hypothetical protein